MWLYLLNKDFLELSLFDIVHMRQEKKICFHFNLFWKRRAIVRPFLTHEINDCCTAKRHSTTAWCHLRIYGTVELEIMHIPTVEFYIHYALISNSISARVLNFSCSCFFFFFCMLKRINLAILKIYAVAWRTLLFDIIRYNHQLILTHVVASNYISRQTSEAYNHNIRVSSLTFR